MNFRPYESRQSFEDGDMELQQESSNIGAPSATTSRNLSSSSSAFFSASQSPFFSPRSSKYNGSELVLLDKLNSSVELLLTNNFLKDGNVDLQSGSSLSTRLLVSDIPQNSNVFASNSENKKEGHTVHDCLSSSDCLCHGGTSSQSQGMDKGIPEYKGLRRRKSKRQAVLSSTQSSTFFSSTCRLKSCDVYIGFHGQNPTLLRFIKWLKAELEHHGVNCFASDRAVCRSAQSRDTADRAMKNSTFGVIILTKVSFRNSYSIRELGYFLGKKNLVPIFFDLGADDCLTRDIIEQRGELWEKHGGELWAFYGGAENEWRDTVDGLMRMDDWKLEACNGNWRNCILDAVILLATRLGRRGSVESINRWRGRVEKEEFPFPRNGNFVGRKKEISELDRILFGNMKENGESEIFDPKSRQRRQRMAPKRKEYNMAGSSSKGKEPVKQKDPQEVMEMGKAKSSQREPQNSRIKSRRKHDWRKKSTIGLYGKGVACISGESGIGKTELALEYAYRFSQRYKMVLWLGGESRYIWQNYLNLRSFFEVDAGPENNTVEKGKPKCFERQEEESIDRIREELMQDIPYLVIIDNLENERDWWDQKHIMDLIPCFTGETHVIITTRLPMVMNLESMKLSFLSAAEAISLMKGSSKDYPIAEFDALRVLEERLNRLTFGLAIVGAVISVLPISPSRLLDTVDKMPLRELTWNESRSLGLGRNPFLVQLFEFCFSVFDHADRSWSLASKMLLVSGWFAPAAIPVSMLRLAACRISDKHHQTKVWRKCLRPLFLLLTGSDIKKKEAEASSLLVRLGFARSSSRPGCIHFHDLIKIYGCRRGSTKAAEAMVHAASFRGFITHHPDHLWSACFLLFGFGTDSAIVETKPSELLFLVKHVALPLAVNTFITSSRCKPALELLRLSTNALEAAEDSLVSKSRKQFQRSVCGLGPIKSDATHTYLGQELALLKASVLETRTKLLLRGGQYDLGDNLIRKAIFIRTSICGEHHPETVSARETLGKLTKLLSSSQFR